MAIIKCKMCGGDIELAADKTFQSQCADYGATACAACQCEVLNTALKGNSLQMLLVQNFDKANIGTLWKLLRIAQGRTQGGKLTAGNAVVVIHNHKGMGDAGVAQFNIGADIFFAVNGNRAVEVNETWVVEADLVSALVDTLADNKTGSAFYALGFTGKTLFVAVAGNASCAVAAHFAQTAIGIIEQHGIIAALFRLGDNHHAVSSDRTVESAELFGKLRKNILRQFFDNVVDDNEVVSGSMHFCENHKLTPQSGEHRNDLLLAAHNTLEESILILGGDIEGQLNKLVLTHIEQVRTVKENIGDHKENKVEILFLLALVHNGKELILALKKMLGVDAGDLADADVVVGDVENLIVRVEQVTGILVVNAVYAEQLLA